MQDLHLRYVVYQGYLLHRDHYTSKTKAVATGSQLTNERSADLNQVIPLFLKRDRAFVSFTWACVFANVYSAMTTTGANSLLFQFIQSPNMSIPWYEVQCTCSLNIDTSVSFAPMHLICVEFMFL